MKSASPRTIEPSVDLPSTPGASDGVIAGRYEVVGALPGPYAAYEVRDRRDDMALVLTQVPDEVARTSHGLARVEAAVRDASRIRHPNLVVPLDLVDDGGRYFVVEPLVAADRLDERAGEPVLAAPEALQAVREIADALMCAHDADVVHGTVGPENVLLAAQGSPRVWLSGFALGALIPEGGPFPAALVSHAAPEIFTSRGADVRTDVFGVGLILFALFEGRPFLSGNPRDVEELLRHGTGPLVPRFSRAVPAGLSSLVSRAVRRAADGRHQKMAHVRAELDGCLRSLVHEPVAPVRPKREVVAPPAPAVVPSEPVATPPPPAPAPDPLSTISATPAFAPEAAAPEKPKAPTKPKRAKAPKKAAAWVKVAAPVKAPAPVEAAPPVQAPAPVEVAPPVESTAPVEVAPPVDVAAAMEAAAPVEATARVEIAAPLWAPSDCAGADQTMVADPARQEPAFSPDVALRMIDEHQHPPVVGKVFLVSVFVGLCWGLVLAFWPPQAMDVAAASRPVPVAGSPDFVGPMPRPTTASSRPGAKPGAKTHAQAAPAPSARKTAPTTAASTRRPAPATPSARVN